MQTDIDLKDIDYAKAMVNTIGRDSGPDLLNFERQSNSSEPIHYM